YAYELLVLLLGATGLHWFYLKKHRHGLFHMAICSLATLSLFFGFLTLDWTLAIVGGAAAVAVAGFWLASWIGIHRQVLGFRMQMESQLVEEICQLSNNEQIPQTAETQPLPV